ncbi:MULTISPECIES: hypothetical protein [Burkholderia]|uniref:hypothetical protein n=1 Tax=Burkholderia TaxID=32008 RepID=UPI000BF9F05A|nr:hypothetical protein [Burkholderia sp. JKS000303]PFH12886.1 hypothetical protein BX604_7306 [Burkholderia sp. JKS000303]
MLPPDDVLVAHLTLLGFLGWRQDWEGKGARENAEWSIWIRGHEAWWNAGQAKVEVFKMEPMQSTFPLVSLDQLPRPLLRKLAAELLECEDER